jgi:glucose/arabinose dehydrogenase
VVVALALIVAVALTGCAITEPATNVGDTAATLTGVIGPGGHPTTYWFKYGTTTSYGNETPRRDAGSGTEGRRVTERITGLTPNTLYHYTACYSNQTGSGCGHDATFRTGASSVAVTEPATDVGDTAATLAGTIVPAGHATQYWFRYGTSTSYGNETPRADAGSGIEGRPVSHRVSGLTPNTLYHYTACFSSETGSGCGDDATFRTGSAGMLPGFQETVAFAGLTNPTALSFSPDGRVFVAEKSGLIKVFDGLADTTPSTFADLRTQVHNFWDRGLLGLALHPDFPAKPFVYVTYTHDAVIGGTAPRWGTPGATADGCPNPPGATGAGCVVSGRLSRLQADGNQMAGEEQVLIEDWCQQFPSHSVGDVGFGADGALYVSGGDGASFNYVDYGQSGDPRNPCGDPPAGVGGTQTPPAAEGGALRSQDVRTTDDPTGLDGAVMRVDPETGEALPTNPLAASDDPDARRIVAYGLRNPFRLAFRPGTSEPWIGDVGSGAWEEINRIAEPVDSAVENFGWPCYEGNGRHGGFDSAGLTLCETLYGAGGVLAPRYTYHHSAKVFPGETCPTGSSSISGLAFNPPGSTLPAAYDGALFFADYSRNCIWVMRRDGGTLPNAAPRTFRAGAAHPVDLEVGPGNDLFYPNLDGGRIMRIHYADGNQAPRAVVNASATSGDTPLSVNFDGGSSSDPDPGDSLSYAWDLDGDGQYDDATGPQASFVYSEARSYRVGLRVSDDHGASATDTVAITAGNTPPTATIVSPTPGFTWRANDSISFEGGAVDPQDGSLPASALSWSIVLFHCPSNCHAHPVQDLAGVDRGSFPGPDHEYPSYLELRLTATDSGGLSDTRSVRLDPRTVELSFETNPSGLALTLNGSTSTAPFTGTVIEGSVNTISAPTPQTLAPATYDFGTWSDGGDRSHTITADAPATYRATYTQRP